MPRPRSHAFLGLILFAALLTACTPGRRGGNGGGDDDDATENNGDTGEGVLPCPSDESDEWVDVFLLPDPGEGVFLQVAVDTVSAATTFDPDLTVYSDPDLDTRLGEADDSFDCTFPPPEYQCPEVELESPGGNIYIEVGIADFEQCAGNQARYELTIRVNGSTNNDAELIRDDVDRDTDSTQASDDDDSASL